MYSNVPPYSWDTHVGRPGMTSWASAMKTGEDWWRLAEAHAETWLWQLKWPKGVYFAVFLSDLSGSLGQPCCIPHISTNIWSLHHEDSHSKADIQDMNVSPTSHLGDPGSLDRWTLEPRQPRFRGKEFMMLWMWFNFRWREYGTELCAWKELCTKLYYTDYTYSYLSLPCLWDYHSMKWNLANLNLVYDLYEHLPIIVDSEKICIFVATNLDSMHLSHPVKCAAFFLHPKPIPAVKLGWSLCETAVMRYQRPWLLLYSDLHQSTIFEARAGATSCLQASLCTNITIVAHSHDDLTDPFWVCLPHAPTKCWKYTFLKYLDLCLIFFMAQKCHNGFFVFLNVSPWKTHMFHLRQVRGRYVSLHDLGESSVGIHPWWSWRSRWPTPARAVLGGKEFSNASGNVRKHQLKHASNMLQTLEIWWNIMEYAQMLCLTHILHVPVVLKMCKHKNERTNSLVVNSIRAELMIVASMNLACSACTCSQFNQSLKTHPQTANRISRM